MNKLKVYTSWWLWKKKLWHLDTLKSGLSPIGAFWLATEILIFWNSNLANSLRQFWPYLILLSLSYAIFDRRPLMSICQRLNNTDIQICVLVGDILTLPGAKVISTNTSFDTKLSENLISSDSLQGRFALKFYEKTDHLDQEIARSLKKTSPRENRTSNVGGNEAVYEIGTVAMVTTNSKTTYLLSIADLSPNGVANSNFEYVKVSLAKLWNYLSENGRFEELSVPVFGTGHARINIPREVVIREILKSFTAACAEGQRRFIPKLTIVISPKDYVAHQIDLIEIGKFLDHVCRYSEINSSRNGAGTPIQ